MPQGDKSAYTDKQKRKAGAIENSHGQKRVGRPAAEGRAWATVNKLHGGGKKIGSGRKVPSGPVGGSGRKTNLARSS
jgi:ribosomal protein L2